MLRRLASPNLLNGGSESSTRQHVAVNHDAVGERPAPRQPGDAVRRRRVRRPDVGVGDDVGVVAVTEGGVGIGGAGHDPGCDAVLADRPVAQLVVADDRLAGPCVAERRGPAVDDDEVSVLTGDAGRQVGVLVIAEQPVDLVAVRPRPGRRVVRTRDRWPGHGRRVAGAGDGVVELVPGVGRVGRARPAHDVGAAALDGDLWERHVAFEIGGVEGHVHPVHEDAVGVGHPLGCAGRRVQGVGRRVRRLRREIDGDRVAPPILRRRSLERAGASLVRTDLAVVDRVEGNRGRVVHVEGEISAAG